MTEVPKIVQYRLRAHGAGRLAEQSHPDADLLAGFAEQALSQPERERVLGHLALCADCRGVVVLALPVAEPAAARAASEALGAEAETASTPISDKPRRSWFAWADMRSFNLRWAALTAGVAVTLFAVYIGLGHRGNPARLGAPQTATSAGPSAPAEIASELPPQNSLEANAAKAQAQPETTAAQPGTAKEKAEASSGGIQSALAKKHALGQPGALAANIRGAQSAAPDQQMPAALAGNLPSSAPPSATQAVEVSAATSEVATASSNTDEMARRRAPSVEKAKPPVDEIVAGKTAVAAAHAPMPLQANGAFATSSALPAATLKQGTIWMIAAGVLKRSLDGGRSWQIVLEGEHPWLCYAAHGQEVWAGGQAGALRHSNDGGASWTSIAVIAHGQPLDSDVIQIDVPYPKIALTTANHETWSSSDGGKTWEKK